MCAHIALKQTQVCFLFYGSSIKQDKFVGHSAFGFVGSWKDVIDKVIELDRIMYPPEETEKPKEAQAKLEQKFYPDSYLRAHGFSSI